MSALVLLVGLTLLLWALSQRRTGQTQAVWVAQQLAGGGLRERWPGAGGGRP